MDRNTLAALALLAASALELVTPFGALGGEPMKVVVLKRHYGIRYAETGASLVLARTTDMLAVLVFLVAGRAQVSVTARSAATGDSERGADGFVAGTAETARDHGPRPARFFAATRK